MVDGQGGGSGDLCEQDLALGGLPPEGHLHQTEEAYLPDQNVLSMSVVGLFEIRSPNFDSAITMSKLPSGRELVHSLQDQSTLSTVASKLGTLQHRHYIKNNIE